MSWNIKTFTSNRGEKPVDEFISHQQAQARSKIVHLLDLLEVYGPHLGMPYSKQILKSLSELRIRGKEEIRIFYCVHNRDIILLHAFKKQTQKTPAKEIEIAKKRMNRIDVL